MIEYHRGGGGGKDFSEHIPKKKKKKQSWILEDGGAYFGIGSGVRVGCGPKSVGIGHLFIGASMSVNI